MRHGPTNPNREPRPSPAQGTDARRAGIRALDCGERDEPPTARREPETDVPQSRAADPELDEQRQAV